VKTNRFKKGRKFRRKLSETCPSGETLSRLVKKVWTHGILLDRRPLKGKRAVTDEELDYIGNQIENSPWKSLRRSAQQSGVSIGSLWTATTLLHVCPYKTTVVPEIRPVDYEKSRISDIIEKTLENKGVCSAVFLDIAQASKRLCHIGLLHKLRSVLPDYFYQLVKSCLTDRHFRFKHEDSCSELKLVKTGVPQGSVLRQLLYLTN
jgi:hypothetical protein